MAAQACVLWMRLRAHGEAHPHVQLATHKNPLIALAADRPPVAAAGFLLYSIVGLALIIYLIFWVAPEHGTENVLVYLAICSLAGSFTVTSCKVGCVLLRCAALSGGAACSASHTLRNTSMSMAVPYPADAVVLRCAGAGCGTQTHVSGTESAGIPAVLRLYGGEAALISGQHVAFLFVHQHPAVPPLGWLEF